MKLEPDEAWKLDRLMEKMDELRGAAKSMGMYMFMGIPDHWYDKPRWRCAEGHVRGGYIKSEYLSRDCCVECGAHVMLSFPEDKDGPLP